MEFPPPLIQLYGSNTEGENNELLSMSDDLTKTPEQLAEEIDAAAGGTVKIALNGDELGDFTDTEDGYKRLQQAAMSYFDSNIIGKTVFNQSMQASIEVRRSGAKKIARLGSSRLKLKLVPATLQLVAQAIRKDSKPSNDPAERNIKAYHYLRAEAKVGEETAKVWMVVKEDDKGAFLYEEFVNKKALTGIAGVTSILDGIGLDDPALSQGNSSVVGGGLVFNLFIEGEEPESASDYEAQDEPVDLPYKFAFVTPGAMSLLRTAYAGGQAKSAYTSAVKIEEGFSRYGMTVSWEAADAMPSYMIRHWVQTYPIHEERRQSGYYLTLWTAD